MGALGEGYTWMPMFYVKIQLLATVRNFCFQLLQFKKFFFLKPSFYVWDIISIYQYKHSIKPLEKYIFYN